MSKWSNIAKYFEENSKSKIYFESESSQKALKQIQNIVKNYFPQMIFLLGEPGSGKTFLLHYLSRYYKDEKYCLMMENPFLTPTELLKRMLNFVGIDSKDKDVESMRLEATQAYKNRPHIIMIDEAQLSHAPLREFIRILSDSKVFWFLIAMHTKEGESLLKNPHFYSRAHQVIYMGTLDKDEIMPYIRQILKNSDYEDIVLSLKNFLLKGVEKYAKGNFRNFKKLCYEFFLLLDYAHENDRIHFTRPNAKILEMAAIKAGLTDSPRQVDFDKLVTIASKKGIKKELPYKKIFAIASIIAILLLGWFVVSSGLFETYYKKIISADAPKSEEVKPLVKKQTQIKKEVFEQKATPSKKNLKLTFYPPDLDIYKKSQQENYENENDDVEVVDYDESLEKEPVFLDDEIKPKRTKPILTVTKIKTDKTKTLLKEFSNSPKYETALELAREYFDKKSLKDASFWAKQANSLNRQEEEPWLIYAKARYAQGHKNDAITSLKLFLDYKSSKKAKNLLNRWTKEKR